MTPREKELTEQFAQCQEALVASRRENELLRQKIDRLVRRVFGSSSEGLDKNQLELLMGLAPESVIPPAKTPIAQPVRSSEKKAARRQRLPTTCR